MLPRRPILPARGPLANHVPSQTPPHLSHSAPLVRPNKPPIASRKGTRHAPPLYHASQSADALCVASPLQPTAFPIGPVCVQICSLDARLPAPPLLEASASSLLSCPCPHYRLARLNPQVLFDAFAVIVTIVTIRQDRHPRDRKSTR